MDPAILPPNRAVFAADRATFCRFLPFLPSRTPNVTVPILTNPLEFRMREDATSNTPAKNGKNGNGDHPSQLYRPVIALPRRVKRAGWGVRAPRHPLAHDAAGFFSPCDISAHFALIRIRQYRDHVAGWAIRQRDGHAPTAVIEYAPNGQAHSMARKGVRTRARVVASVRGGERGRAASAHVFREYPVHTSYTVHRHPVRVWRVGG
jgi:hypothetical protein